MARMSNRVNGITRWLGISAFVLLVLGLGGSAYAQNGTISGRVIDSDRRGTDRDGKALVGRINPTDFKIGLGAGTVTFELKAEPAKKFQTLTDADGEFYKSGLPPGTYDISVRAEWRDPVPGRTTKLQVFVATATGVVLKPGEKLRLPEMHALTEEAIAAGHRPPAPAVTGGTNAPVKATAATEAANKRVAEIQALLKDAEAASAAGNLADAIAKVVVVAEKKAEQGDPCGECYVKIGDWQLKLKDLPKAEAAFLKAIELNPKMADPYAQLAALYNGQQKFDDALKMSKKASELAGTTTEGGNAITSFNQGVILWNGGQAEEARAEFLKAVKLDPKMAKAQYHLGLTTYSLAATGKVTMQDAKGPLQEYLKLEPTGEYADTAKALLATIK